MALQHINPPELYRPRDYTHVVAASGARTAYISGQAASDKDGKLVGVGDLQAQANQAFANLAAALAAVGADFKNVAKVTIYVVDYRAGMRSAIQRALGEHFGDQPPASTLIGVTALALPEFLIEIDAVADLD